MSRFRLRPLVVMVLLIGVQLAASALTVVVNGRTLPGYPPAIMINGRTLLPMRMVFEALGAQVTWIESTQTAVGTRGGVTVRLTINSATAFINERATMLDVPAQLVGGSTYVPLRFPAEAFGAEVRWSEASQTATITLPEGPAPLPPPVTPPAPEPTPPPLPPPPPAPQGGTVVGVITGSEPGRVVLSVDDALQMYTLTRSTVILRQGQQVAATELQPGDRAEVQYDEQNNAKVVRATYETIEGRVAARVPNQIVLEGRNDLFSVAPQAGIGIYGSQETAQYEDIHNGDTVVLRVTPGTTRVWGIRLRRAAAPPGPGPIPSLPPERVAPVIYRLFSDVQGPLRGGAVVHVMLEGTPRGLATFDIGASRKEMQMREQANRPGHYQGEWIVPDKMNVLGVPLVGHLRVNGVWADPAESTETITVDNLPPRVTVYGPTANEEITIRQPNLAVSISDENGSGVDVRNTLIVLNAGGDAIPTQVRREGRLWTLQFQPLPPGPITLSVDAVDRAGNVNHVEWRFRVAPRAVQPTFWASHDATGTVLNGGDVLTVTATGPAGGQASFSLGAWRVNLPMAEVAGYPGSYQGTFTVPALQADRQETVVVRLRRANGEVLTATLTPPVAFGRTQNLAPVIYRPQPGAHVGQTVVIEGMTRPYAQVECLITWKAELLGPVQLGGQVARAVLTADQQGHFQTDPISLDVESLVSGRGRTFTLTCTATKAGHTSEPVVVKFQQ